MSQDGSEKDRLRHFSDILDSDRTQAKRMSPIRVHFTCHSWQSRKSGVSPIVMETRISGKRVRINTDYDIPFGEWDERNQRIKGRSKEINDMNLVLDGMRSKANRIETEYRLREVSLTAKLFKEEFENRTSRIDFLKYYEVKMHKRLNDCDITDSTYKQNRTNYRRLKNFRSEIMFSELNIDFIKEFERFLRNKLKLKPDSIRTSMKNTRTYIRLAMGERINVDDPFVIYKIGEFDSSIESFTSDELKKWMAYYDSEFTTEAEKRVLEPFLFSCLNGGIRYSDWSLLKKGMLDQGVLRYKPKKTERYNVWCEIPINIKSMKYLCDSSDRNELFKQTHSHSFTYRYLNQIARRMNFRIKVGTHIARHTFGTLFCEATDDNLRACMKLMGHRKLEQTLAYSHTTKELLKRTMDRYGGWLDL